MTRMQTRREKTTKYSVKLLANGGHSFNKVYWRQAVVYGKIIELYEYDSVKFTHKELHRFDYNKSDTGKRRSSSIVRARREIYRIAEANTGRWGNYLPVFFTLTFKENQQNLREANVEYRNFIRRLNRFLRFKVKYLVVPEFQKRGAVHYHGVFFNLPHVDILKFRGIWSKGYVDLQGVKKIRSISAYIAKYLSKDTLDSRLYGERAYFTSRDLYRPINIVDDHVIDSFLKDAIVIGTTSFTSKLFNYKKLICANYIT